MALTSYDNIIAAIQAGKFQERYFSKTTSGMTLLSGGSGAYDFWMQGTFPPAADQTPLDRSTNAAPAAGTFTAFKNKTAVITGITAASPAVVTTAAAHGFENGDRVFITGVVGMTQMNDYFVTVANKTSTTFECSGVNASGFTAYSSGGQASMGYGAIPFTNAAGGEELRVVMMGAQASAAAAGSLLLYDRVGQIEQLNIGSTGTQAITATLPRYTTEGTMVFAEHITGTVTTTAPQFRLSKYTDQDGNVDQVSPTITGVTGTGLIGRFAYSFKWWMDLLSGDTGVRDIDEFECTVANATGTARIQLVFAKPLAIVPLTGLGVRVERDCVLASVRLPKIPDDACLALAVLPASSTAQVITGEIAAVSG